MHTRPPAFQELYHSESTYLEKAPTAQLTRIDAAVTGCSPHLNTHNKCTGVCRFVRGIPVGIRHRVAELWGSCGARESPLTCLAGRHGHPVGFQNPAIVVDLGFLRGPLIFVEEAAKHWPTLDRHLGEIGDRVIGYGRAELAAAMRSSAVVVGLVLG
jgi:hypothetical protein